MSFLRSVIEAADGVRVRLAAGASRRSAGTFGADRFHRLLLADAPIHPLLRSFASEMQATLMRACAYACALAAFALIGWELVSRQPGTVVAQAAPPEWIEVVKPLPAFAISVPELTGETQYTIRRHATGGGRKDILSVGDAAAGEATATVEIYRPGAEAAQDDASVPDLRLSIPVVQRMIDTKFGLAVAEDLTEGDRRCLRATRRFDDPPLVIDGKFCNAGRELVDRRMVACALDRLTLLSAASDPKLTALFARAELKRNFCGANNVFVAATPKRADWIEAPRDPKLRGRQ